jgi:Domain of unknown function (DUF4388)
MDYAKEGNFVLDGQNIVVDHLVKIIQAIQIGRTTGSLIATRGEGASYELGTMMFLNGRVVQARVGRREGRDAFNLLSTWGKCRYTFVLSVTSESVTESLSAGNPDLLIQEEDKVSPRDSEQVNETVPYRSKPLEYGLRVLSEKSLSRTHRHVFLLVNGARSVLELMRLLKRDENEVLTLLYDLQDTGVISLPIPLSL